VFNTYGQLSSGALLYRYGFTDAGNPYDLVNVDSHQVAAAAAAAPGCSPRQVRARWALWRAAGCHLLTSQVRPRLWYAIPLFVASAPGGSREESSLLQAVL
jgi:hypothetical protein